MEMLALKMGHSQGCTFLYNLGGKYQSDMNEMLLYNNICKCDMRITLEWFEVLLIFAPIIDAIYYGRTNLHGKRVATWIVVSYCPNDTAFTRTSGSGCGSVLMVLSKLLVWILELSSK